MNDALPPVVILAGGLGTRLGRRTAATPKALMSVAGRPFIEWQLLALSAAGFGRVVLAVGHLGDQVERAIGNGAHLGIAVSYSWDGASPRGTMGAVRHACPLLGDTVPVLFGDTFLSVDFAKVVREHWSATCEMTMCVLRNAGNWDTSNARIDGHLVVAYGKDPAPSGAEWIDYGFSVIRREAIVRSDENDLGEWTARAAAAGQVRAFRVDERFYEIGTPDSLAETDAHLRRVFPAGL